MKIITWNIYSVLNQKDQIMKLLIDHNPDILFIQETVNSNYFKELNDFKNLGYTVIKSNPSNKNNKSGSVSTFTKLAHKIVDTNWLDTDGRFQLINFERVKCLNIRIPEGNPVSSEKERFKEDYLNDIFAMVSEHVTRGPFLIAGNLNICATHMDCFSDSDHDARMNKSSVDIFWKMIINQGFRDAWRVNHIEEEQYTSFESGSWDKKEGLRLHYILCSKHIRIPESKILYNYYDPDYKFSANDNIINCPVYSNLDIRFGQYF